MINQPEAWLVTWNTGHQTAVPGRRRPPQYGNKCKIEPLGRIQGEISCPADQARDMMPAKNGIARILFGALYAELSQEEQVKVDDVFLRCASYATSV